MTDARAFRGFRFPAEVILWAVRWYLQFPISYRELERMLADRGVVVDHTIMYRWVQRLDDGNDLRMGGSTGVAEARGEIGRPDEDAVDAIDGGDRLAGLDLNQQAELLLGVGRVAGDATEAGGPCQGRDAADAARRIAHGRDRNRRCLGRLHVGDQQGLGTDVEEAIDEDGIVGRWPDDRGGVGCRCLQLRQHGQGIAWAVLGVEEQPVIAGAGEKLGDVGPGQRRPEADLAPARAQAGLEGVRRELHGPHSGRKETPMPPSGP